MFTVQQTEEFQRWLDDLADMRAQVRIVARIRLAEAAGGDIKRAQRIARELGEEP